MMNSSLKLKAQSSKLNARERMISSFFTFIFFLLALHVHLLARGVYAATIGPVDGALTTVSARIGEEPNVTPTPIDTGERFSIYGNTSPNATVKLQSPIYGETKADATGAYEFKYLFLTLFREDLCIVAQDTEGSSTPPLCIPPPSVSANKRVGPVILPPTTKISSGNAYIGDTVTLTGQTIPNADVKLSLFTDENQKNKVISLIPQAYAYTIPQISLNSNKRGEYSIQLPTASSQFLRMFSRAIFDGNSTPKGLTLVLDIFPVWMMLFKFFANFFAFLKAHIIELILLSQLYFLLMYFLRRFFNPHALSSRRHNELAVIHGEITLLPHEIAIKRESRLALRNNAIIIRY